MSHIIKREKLPTYGMIECWKSYCDVKVKEGWELKGAFKYFERQLLLKNEDGEVIDKIVYEDFSTISKSMFYRITQYLILGEPYNLGHYNGNLKARRIESNYEEKKWSKLGLTETKEYWGGEDWCIIQWNHPPPSLGKNDAFPVTLPEGHFEKLKRYEFKIGRDNRGTGFKERFNKAIKYNPTLQYGFDFLASNSII